MSQTNKKVSESEVDKVMHSYHDHANDVEEESAQALQNHLVELSLYRPADQNFTARLHRLLTHTAQEGISHIISWQPHGRSFLVHNKQEFEQQVMPRWFQQSSLSSFLRQLNLYGFMRLHKGPDKGGYYHERFLRGKPTLCRRIERTRIKGRGARKAVSHDSEPDFYQMTPLPPDDDHSPDIAVGRPSADESKESSNRSLPAPLEPTGPISELARQRESQQTDMIQQILQELRGNEQSMSLMPMPMSSAATLPHVNTNQVQQGPRPNRAVESQATNPSDSGSQQLLSAIQTVDSSSLYWSSIGMSHSSSTTATQPDLLGGQDAPVGTQTSTRRASSAPAGLPTQQTLATVLETEKGQDLSDQAPLSSLSASQQQLLLQSFLDPSSTISLQNATGYLASLFEPTAFPELPNHPPTQHHHQNQVQSLLSQSQALLLSGDQAISADATQQAACPQRQNPQTRPLNSGDPSNAGFSGTYPPF